MLATLAVSVAPAMAQSVSFDGPTNFTADGPFGVAVGDFNADTDPDLATVTSSGHVSILLGGAGGSFGAQRTFAAGESPAAIVAGDFNGDSDPDLATANTGVGDVTILLGGAGGSFGPPTTFAAGDNSRSLAVGDFNGDSDPDLAVGNIDSNDVSILLGEDGRKLRPPDQRRCRRRPPRGGGGRLQRRLGSGPRGCQRERRHGLDRARRGGWQLRRPDGVRRR